MRHDIFKFICVRLSLMLRFSTPREPNKDIILNDPGWGLLPSRLIHQIASPHTLGAAPLLILCAHYDLRNAKCVSCYFY